MASDYAFPELPRDGSMSPYSPPPSIPSLFPAEEASCAVYLADPIAGADWCARAVYAMARSHRAAIPRPPRPPREDGRLREYRSTLLEYLDAAAARIAVATAAPGVAIPATSRASPSSRKRKRSLTELASDADAPAPKRRRLADSIHDDVSQRGCSGRPKRGMGRGRVHRMRGSEDVSATGAVPLGDEISTGTGLPAQITLKPHNSSDMSDDARQRFAEA